MKWAALRAGVRDDDWGAQAWDCLFKEVHARGLDYTLPKPSRDMNSFVWQQFADKHDQVAVVRFVLMHPDGCSPVAASDVRAFTPHSPRFFYDSCGTSFGFSEDERRNFGNWAKGSKMPQRYDASVCGEQLTRRGELLGLLRKGWRPPPAREPGLPRTPSGDVGIPRMPSGGCMIVSSAQGCALPECASSAGRSMSKALKCVLAEGPFAACISSLGDRTVHIIRAGGLWRVTRCGLQLGADADITSTLLTLQGGALAFLQAYLLWKLRADRPNHREYANDRQCFAASAHQCFCSGVDVASSFGPLRCCLRFALYPQG